MRTTLKILRPKFNYKLGLKLIELKSYQKLRYPKREVLHETDFSKLQ